MVMTVGTLGVISWAEHEHGLAIARTMGMVTFALFLLFFSIESKDQRDSAFSLDTFSDKTFIVTTSGSFVLLILSTVKWCCGGPRAPDRSVRFRAMPARPARWAAQLAGAHADPESAVARRPAMGPAPAA